MKKIYYSLIVGCFICLLSMFSFSFSNGAGIIIAAILLEIFSRICFRRNYGVW